MAGIYNNIYSASFTATSTIVVTHNADVEYLQVKIIVGDVTREDLISNITPTVANETNELTVTLTSSQTGIIQLFTSDLVDIGDLKASDKAAGGGATAWGSIIGTITDQTDLITYIDTATEEEMFAQQVDFIGNDLIYRAEADPGAATSAAVWRIRKIDIDNPSQGDIATTWADGNANFDNVWDDRLGLSYS